MWKNETFPHVNTNYEQADVDHEPEDHATDLFPPVIASGESCVVELPRSPDHYEIER
jgi:hypothetical protein